MALFHVAPSRLLRLSADRSRPWILYTDGSAEHSKTHQRCGLAEFRSSAIAMEFQVGAVLWNPHTGQKLYTMATVPAQVVASWIPKRQMIGQVELFGAVLGLLAFRDELTDADIIHFVDNDSATSALIKGYSGKQDSARLVGMYWMLAALHRMNVYIDRVESKSNPADAPSRGCKDQLEACGFVGRDPLLSFFDIDPTMSPLDWFQSQPASLSCSSAP
eukprot:1704575-Amphidinium_carterae.1